MLLDFSLKGLFVDLLRSPEPSTGAALACYDFLHTTTFDASTAAADLAEGLDVEALDPPALLDAWRDLLTLLLLQEICFERTRPLDAAALGRMQVLLRTPLWSGMQLEKGLAAACCTLLDYPYPQYGPVVTPSGAAPVDGGDASQSPLWSWGSVPHQRYHAELGLVWAVRLLAADGALERVRSGAFHDPLAPVYDALEGAARWQLNTLDAQFLPMNGLYAREEDTSLSQQLVTNSLLFDAVGRCTSSGRMVMTGDRQREHLWRLRGEGQLTCCRWLDFAIGGWLERRGVLPPPEEMTLPSSVEDEHLIFSVARGEDRTFAATVTGGSSGLGACVVDDVAVRTYGFQQLPLGDCRRFGLRDANVHQPWIVTRPPGFSLGGRVQLADSSENEGSRALYGHTGVGGAWVDVEQTLEKGVFTIKADFYSVIPHDQLAFVFFAKANACQLHSGQTVRPCSFDRYEGPVQHVTLVGARRGVALGAGCSAGHLQVIPLPGDDTFWGANLLVAYVLDPNCSEYRWTLQ